MEFGNLYCIHEVAGLAGTLNSQDQSSNKENSSVTPPPLSVAPDDVKVENFRQSKIRKIKISNFRSGAQILEKKYSRVTIECNTDTQYLQKCRTVPIKCNTDTQYLQRCGAVHAKSNTDTQYLQRYSIMQ